MTGPDIPSNLESGELSAGRWKDLLSLANRPNETEAKKQEAQ